MSNSYEKIAKNILDGVGGVVNIDSVLHCYTRLRINVKDKNQVNEDYIKDLNIIGLQYSGNQLQIIIGNEVKDVYEAFIEVSGMVGGEAVVENHEELTILNKKNKITPKSFLTGVIDGIVGCMIPILPMLVASGILKAIVLIGEQFHWLSSTSSTAVVLSFVADAAFYFLPVILGVFSARKFGANLALGGMLGAALIHPTFVGLVSDGIQQDFFGIPIYNASYSSTVIPVILSVWVMSYIEKFISNYSPKSIRSILEPVLTILIMIPLMFGLLAPLGAMFSDGFASLLEWLYGSFGFIAVGVFSAIIPWIVMFGMHVSVIPISIAAIAATGSDNLILPALIISNFAQGAACLAVALKTKSTDTKSLGYSSAFSNFVPGVSEPGMYGITLKYKKPMWAAMIGAAVGGLYIGIQGVGAFSFVAPNLFGLAAFIGTNGQQNNLLHMVIGIIITIAVTLAATLVLYKPEYD